MFLYTFVPIYISSLELSFPSKQFSVETNRNYFRLFLLKEREEIQTVKSQFIYLIHLPISWTPTISIYKYQEYLYANIILGLHLLFMEPVGEISYSSSSEKLQYKIKK